jgi:hypothetical protein
MATKVCTQCGKEIHGEHIEFDGTDCFCDEDCATEFFKGDRGCVEIMLDDGERLTWED